MERRKRNGEREKKEEERGRKELVLSPKTQKQCLTIWSCLVLMEQSCQHPPGNTKSLV